MIVEVLSEVADCVDKIFVVMSPRRKTKELIK
jgi:GTP:adenosylcobinamide-phosphate guanylyltransferase